MSDKLLSLSFVDGCKQKTVTRYIIGKKYDDMKSLVCENIILILVLILPF